jgi:hypothetical protein
LKDLLAMVPEHTREHYTAHHLANAPGVGQQVTLTKIEMIK